MMGDNQKDTFMLTAAVPGMDYQDGHEQEEGTANLWAVVDDRLRGRWRYMFVVGVVLALVLAPLGYFSTKPIFESEGIIHIKPEGDPILTLTPETETMHEYPQFLQTQAATIESARILQEALKQEGLREYPWVRQANAVNTLKNGLSVEAPRLSQFIYVVFEDEDPKQAQACVQAVLHAYIAQAGDVGANRAAGKIDTLQKRRQALNTQLGDAQGRIRNLPSVLRFMTTHLQPVLDQKVAEVSEVEEQLRWIRIAQSMNEDGELEQGEAIDNSLPAATQLDLIDPELAIFRAERDFRLRRLDQLRQTYGDEARQIRVATRELEAAEEQLKEREAAALALWEQQGAMIVDPRAHDSSLTASQRLIKEQELLANQRTIQQDIMLLGADIEKAEDLRREIELLRSEIVEVESRIAELEMEVVGFDRNRISIFQEGMRAVDPAKDRRTPFAALGAIGGFGLSFVVFFLIGSIDRRAYRLTQLHADAQIPSLGVLPDLGRSLQDPESAEMAAHCVHQIRNLIEATRPATERGTVMAVSSPYQGDGKTSITLALGFSYAAAGNRTLVVDGDLVGRGLTRQLNLSGANGVKEVIRDGNVNGEIVALAPGATQGSEGRALNALPVGVDNSIAPHGIRKADMTTLFDQLRDMYDIVIVDTGPVLGSLECIPIVAAADGVVLSVRRGRQRSRLDECVNYLKSVGATCYGVVMNCAARSECHRYVSEMSIAPTQAQLADSSVLDAQQKGRRRENVLVSAMRAADDDEVSSRD